MIRNLNQVTFQLFGTVPSEKSQNSRPADKPMAASWKLQKTEAALYRAASETWGSCGSGISVLTVSRDGETFHQFYLDKTACIAPGVLFSLSPFLDEATALVYTESQPEQVGVRGSDSLRVDHQLQVEGIYTFFYQEKEQGFLFPGESHPMAELTYVDQGALHSVAEGQDLLLKQGDIVIYGPNQWHMQ